MEKQEQSNIMVGKMYAQCEKLKKDLEKFKKLEQEIHFLNQAGEGDLKAKKRIEELKMVYPGGLKKEKAQIESCVNDLKVQFKQLKTYINNLHISTQ